MTIHLANGGRITVRQNGTVEVRRNGRTLVSPGRGSYAETMAHIRANGFGRDVRYVKG